MEGDGEGLACWKKRANGIRSSLGLGIGDSMQIFAQSV